MKNTADDKVIEAMKKYGGGFVAALAEAAIMADGDNLDRIKKTWPEYWQKYGSFAAEDQKAKGTSPEVAQ